jgi:hypothetical protein
MLCHPKVCVFTPNAAENIIAKWKASGYGSVHDFGAIDFIEAAFKAEEIYCPHEGIDNRAEYYAKANLAGWMEWSAIAHEMV